MVHQAKKKFSHSHRNDAGKMFIKLLLLFFAVVVTIATSIEVRRRFRECIHIDIEENENLATLRQKLKRFHFFPSSGEWWPINARNKSISIDFEEDILVDQNKKFIIVDIRTNKVKVCFNAYSNRCNDVNINGNTNLKNVRDELMAQGFIYNNECADWRFMDSNAVVNVTGGKKAVKQAFIKDDWNVDNVIIDNNSCIPMVNYYNINLEDVYVFQQCIYFTFTTLHIDTIFRNNFISKINDYCWSIVIL